MEVGRHHQGIGEREGWQQHTFYCFRESTLTRIRVDACIAKAKRAGARSARAPALIFPLASQFRGSPPARNLSNVVAVVVAVVAAVVAIFVLGVG